MSSACVLVCCQVLIRAQRFVFCTAVERKMTAFRVTTVAPKNRCVRQKDQKPKMRQKAVYRSVSCTRNPFLNRQENTDVDDLLFSQYQVGCVVYGS